MSKQRPKSHKKWRCVKCKATYNSPVPVLAVNCPGCSSRAGGGYKAVEMKPDE